MKRSGPKYVTLDTVDMASLFFTVIHVIICLTFTRCLDGAVYTSQLMYKVENAESASVSETAVELSTEQHCVLRCLMLHPACTAVNYEGVAGSSGLHLCRTYNIDMYTDSSLLTSSATFTFYSVHSSVLRLNLGSLYSSCVDVPDGSPSGQYWIDPTSSGVGMLVWCDMDTDGGHWTLVYSYELTSPSNFHTPSNAVTPVPSWSTTRTVGPTSNEQPTTEEALAAMQFSLWSALGDSFLIKSTINHWLACTPDVGDFVRWVPGAITCRMVQEEATACSTDFTYELSFPPCGPAIRNPASNFIYYWDGCTDTHFPTHDPCGENGAVNVAEVKGQIYIRNY